MTAACVVGPSGHDRLPAGAAIKSLGEHGLEDVACRQTTYQLAHPSLPQAFPPLRTLLAPFDASVPSIAVLPFVGMCRDEKAATLAKLERAYLQNDHGVGLLRSLTTFRGLHDDPRWWAHLAKIGPAD